MGEDKPRGTGAAGFEAAGGVGDQLGFWGPMLQSAGKTAESADFLGDMFNLGGAGNHMGGVGSVFGLGTGLYNMINGDTATEQVMGGANALTGGIGTAGWIGSLMGAETGIMGGLASAGGAMGMNAPAFAASTWGAGAGGGAALGTGLATGGAVLGAGLAGYGIGSYGNDMSKKYGVFGTGEDGENRSASDWAADAGRGAESATDSIFGEDSIAGDIAGGATTIGASVVGAVPAVGSAILGAGSAALSFVGGIFSW